MELKALIPPEDDIKSLELSDLIDVADIQSMMDNFYRIAGITMAIIDLKGKVVVGVGWQEICTRFHRVHPETCRNCIESDLQLTTDIPKGEFRLYKCKNGMWDMATPMMIGDHHIGNLFIGQFFFEEEKINYRYFRSQASRYGFNRKDYIEALEKVTILSNVDLDCAKTFFLKLTDSLSNLSYSNIKLLRANKETRLLADSLRISEEGFKRSQEIAHLGSWELLLSDNSLKWSDEVYRIFGLEPGETKPGYETFLGFVHPDDREAVNNAYISSLRKDRKGYEIDHRIVRKNTGEIRYVHEKCEHFRDSSGKIVRSSGMVHDITDRKIAEKELKESREKLSIALEIGNIGIWEWDSATGQIIMDNRMERMLGMEPGSFKGTFSDLESLLNEEDIPRFRNTISKAGKDSAIDTIIRIKPNINEEKYLNIKILVENNSSGFPRKMTGVCFDITEMKKGAEQSLFRLNEELLRSNKALEQFAYIASHDLQEPLRMISSFTELLSIKYREGLDDTAREYIKYSVEGAERLYEMINGLLAYSRIQTRAKEFMETDMNQVVQKVKNNLALQIRTSHAILTSDSLPVIQADENQMVQLMQNLLSNSIKFCRKAPRIHVSFISGPDNNIFSISDNGIGIEPQYRERIFKIFQRLQPRGEYPGTGIGLAICKMIVERHGGKIWMEPNPGRGSKFCFTIPKKPVT